MSPNANKWSSRFNRQTKLLRAASLSAPLTLPGINIVEGDYLLAVNARELHATDNIDAFFDGTAGKQTVLRIARTALS